MFIDKRDCTVEECEEFEKSLKINGYIENNDFFNVQELWKEICEYIKSGFFNVFFNFNSKYILLEDENISEDDVYLFILGKTKDEYELYLKNRAEVYDREEREFKQKIPELKQKYNQMDLVEEKYKEKWIEIVDISLKSIYRDFLIESVIEILEMSNSGASFEEIKEKFYTQGHSGYSYSLARLMFRDLSDRGLEFYVWSEKNL